MSMNIGTNAIPIQPARPEAPTSPRRILEVVTTKAQRKRRPRILYAIVAVAGLMAIVGAQLLLSIATSSGAYQITALQDESRALTRTSEDLGEKLEIFSATQHLARSAAHLGMVPAASPTYLDISTGGTAGAPGMPDPFACGGACGLVENALIASLPLVAPGQSNVNPAEFKLDGGVVNTGPVVADSLPAPVTH